jgi:hypothetical protein
MTGLIEETGTERERRERQRDVKTGEERSTLKRIEREIEIDKKLEIVQSEDRRKEEQIKVTCTTEYGQRLCHSQRQ